MSDEASKRHARLWLSGHGFAVSEIARVEGPRRADLRASWPPEEYALEAKGKAESKFWLRLLATARDEVSAADSRQVLYSNKISSVIRKASGQLKATPLPDTAFRIIWVLVPHGDSSFILEAFEKTLFGSRELVCVRSRSRGLPDVETKTCYYYDNCDFARSEDLDAAILATENSSRMCVNSFSGRRIALRSSRLYRIHAGCGAVIDPEIAGRRGDTLLIDESVPAVERQAYLQKRYRVRTNPMIEDQFVGLAAVDIGKLDKRGQ
jgi:hypothetical protein